MSHIFIGTSGFSYSHWKGIFYPQDLPPKNWFKFYCQNFQTVEINSSFYHLPKKETFEKWRREAGPDFVFSIKGWRWITHIKKLKDCQNEVEKFFKAAEGVWVQGCSSRSCQKTANCSKNVGNYSFEGNSCLKNKVNNPCEMTTATSSTPSPLEVKEVILWQLPPRLKADTKRLEEFLKILAVYSPSRCAAGATPPGRCSLSSWHHAFEFRNKSWLNEEVYELLKKNSAAIVFQDYPEWPITQKVTADFVYLRFHGKTSLYSSCYTKKELKEWAEKIKEWLSRGLDVYGYFNNDAMGWAVENAKELILNVKTKT